MIGLVAAGGLLLDQLLGELHESRHPLVHFGRLAEWLEARFNIPESNQDAAGVVAVLLLVLPLAGVAWLLSEAVGLIFDLLLLYLVLGGRSLADHARPVAAALNAGDLPQARALLGRMVNWDTGQLNEEGVTRATIESLLAHAVGAVFGALFWFFLAGAPGLLIYRLINTLDAIWGHRNERFAEFGWFAARADDLLNWIPARLTGLTYALSGERRQAMRCWRFQSSQLESPNGGVAMTAGAGALGLLLGGSAHHQGTRPEFGIGRNPTTADIGNTIDLLQKGMVIWVLAMLLWELLFG